MSVSSTEKDNPVNMAQPIDAGTSQAPSTVNTILSWVAVVLLIYVLLVGVSVISSGFRSAVGDQAEQLFAFATNPFAGLVIGILATALLQSSSAVTAIIVGLVAGGLPVVIAVPMVMGSNIGTSVTSGIVSLGYVRERETFKKAFASSTILDLFNLLAVLIFFPLELLFHPLERMAGIVAGVFVGGSDLSIDNLNFVSMLTRPARNLVRDAVSFLPAPYDGIAQIVIGVALIFLAVILLGRLLKVLLVGRAKDVLYKTIGRGAITAIIAGAIATILVQSSTTTTSLMVPIAGAGVLGLSVIYPFILGANIGTTVTALLSATAVTGDRAFPALQIALVHMFFNLLGVIIIYGIPFLRRIPLDLSERLALAASNNKTVAFVYLIGVFFVVPIGLLGLSLLLQR